MSDSVVQTVEADLLCSEPLTTDLYEFLVKYLSETVLNSSLIR